MKYIYITYFSTINVENLLKVKDNFKGNSLVIKEIRNSNNSRLIKRNIKWYYCERVIKVYFKNK